MILPNLIIPGAGKSGTSSLHRYLNQHPDIYMSQVKEPAYFFRDELYQSKAQWYSGLFEAGKDKKYRGESSTYYFKYQPALQRMKNDLVRPKFIILIRHPVERIISHYFWLKGKGLEFRPFRKAVELDMYQVFRPGYHIKGHYKCYIQNSFYSKWIKAYFDVFGKENVLIISTEKLKSEPLPTLNNCFQFLGLETMNDIKITTHNESVHRAPFYADRLMLHLLFMENDHSLFFRLKSKLIPPFVKTTYWKVHTRVTQNRYLPQKPQISTEDYKWLLSLLKDDISKLKILTANSFDEWRDLKSL